MPDTKITKGTYTKFMILAFDMQGVPIVTLQGQFIKADRVEIRDTIPELKLVVRKIVKLIIPYVKVDSQLLRQVSK